MTDVRLRGMPSLPWFSSFPELNVRTYVTVNGKPGVYFFSLDAASRVAVVAARAWYHLPYFHATMRCTGDAGGGGIQYSSRRTDRRGAPAELIANYRPTEQTPLQDNVIARWLTERYCLYTTNRTGMLFCGDIHHRQWPLQPAGAEIQKNTMMTAAGISPIRTEPLLHFSRRLDVLIWPLKPCRCTIS
ncbi:MAG: YqjF family protein [Candidatus Sumerlaeaceae bacterium]